METLSLEECGVEGSKLLISFNTKHTVLFVWTGRVQGLGGGLRYIPIINYEDCIGRKDVWRSTKSIDFRAKLQNVTGTA